MCENYSAPAGEPCIVMTVSVCFCAYLSKYASDLYPILCMLPMAVARSSAGGVAIRYTIIRYTILRPSLGMQNCPDFYIAPNPIIKQS